MKESKFQLISKPRVTKTSFEINQAFSLKQSDEIELSMNNDVQVLTKDNEAIVILAVSIFKDQPFNHVPFSLEMTIEGYFSWEEELQQNEAELNILLSENAPAILYSYLRPLITMLTVEGNFAPLVIPVMNFRK